MNWKQYILGILFALMGVMFIMAVTAATVIVYYAGGDVIGNVDTPTADSHGATKAYVDSGGIRPCVPRKDSFSTTSTESGNICTNCEGWFTRMEVTAIGTSSCSAEVDVDGLDGTDVSYSLGGGFWRAHFSNNLTYTVTEGSSGTCQLNVTYCEAI